MHTPGLKQASPDDAAALVRDGDTLATAGSSAMGFRPPLARALRLMPSEIFRDTPMSLSLPPPQ